MTEFVLLYRSTPEAHDEAMGSPERAQASMAKWRTSMDGMQQIPKQPPGQRVEVFNLHKSIGLTILALMIVRLGWRLAHRPPEYPPMARWQARLARWTHAGLYVVLIALPLAGYLGSSFSG